MFSAKNLTVVEFNKEIALNLEKSGGASLYDDNSGKSFLDFFQFFSSNPLGYNHEVFTSKEFAYDLVKYSQVKISSGKIYFQYFSDFIEEFHAFCSRRVFEKYYFIHGGALAVENALKVAFDWKRQRSEIPAKDFKVISFRNAFHGVSGYTIGLSDLPPVKVDHFPKFDWPKFDPPVFDPSDPGKAQAKEAELLETMESYLSEVGADSVAALLIEPIECSGGDNQFSKSFFEGLRRFCDAHNICLIFDEIQTGFGVTGTLWNWEQFRVSPDILVFGKKAQVCGIALSSSLAHSPAVLEPGRVSVTWDGHIADIVRARHLIRYMSRSPELLDNVKARGAQLLEGLVDLKEVSHPRGSGLLLAFDLPSRQKRDAFVSAAFDRGLIVNVALDKTIRLRPPLNVTQKEVDRFFELSRSALGSI